ncbi:MAG: zinc ABC transporter substrate-binding protein [Lachnospiraceae bacterium]|nr:zinc ABC transporter substrate-binding protein [Lachnospiraceae bacterium]
MKNKYIFTALLLTVLTVVSALTVHFSKGAANQKEGLLIVTSFYPVYIAAINVTDGIEGVQVQCLSSPSAGCVHDHQLTTGDMVLLEQADVFIINGAGMETYLGAVKERFPELTVVDTSKGTALLEAGEGHKHEEEHDAEEEEHIHNSHIWMSMENYCIQIGNIGNALIQMDSANQEKYEANMHAYQNAVKELLREGQKELHEAAGQKFVSTHEAFSYFAENFQWEMVKTINMDENTNLKASELGQILTAVEEEQISYVFAEEIYGRSLSRILEDETGCQTVLLDTLVTGSKEKDAYLMGMRNNIKALKEALDHEKVR